MSDNGNGKVRVFVIAAEHIHETGEVSFKFMFDALPMSDPDKRKILDGLVHYGHWGYLTLGEKSENHLDPFKVGNNLREGKPMFSRAVGPDGHERWNLNVFKGGEGLKIGIGVDHSGETPDVAMVRALSDEFDLDSVLLADRKTADEFEAVCEAVEGIEFGRFDMEGCLSTS